ncbi:MAG: GSU2403 family nucleotidyltransferase fold protein [Parvibaculum sp.]|uniref:GSU2403 family nucleotidyltransferase fold protein n=1 Tax=Parvibaculum sp. TaxID=2024848 RepID=UPI0032EEA0B5
MSSKIPMAMHTAYADLVDRCAAAAFEDAFAGDGTFVAKTVRGRKYWYFQESTSEGRRQKYVGPETEDLLEQIARHRNAQDDTRDRQSLVSMLVRSAYLPRPQAKMGQVIQALAEAGVFRLRAVLIGTTAYQTYAAMLGVRLPAASIQTGDIDIAQHRTISVATEDKTPPALSVLQEVDPSFRAVPHFDPTRSTSYIADGGVRVDFLTPNRGGDSDEPEPLPALGTDAAPLRFLDYLIHEPQHAVVLHGPGIYVTVPSPERYALHKLIFTQRRNDRSEKGPKNIVQAESLLSVLVEDRPYELSAAWADAVKRGKTWKRHLAQGLAQVSAGTRDRLLQTVGEMRSFLPGLDLKFAASPARYDPNRDVVFFYGIAGGERHRCAISTEAIEDHFLDHEEESGSDFGDIEVNKKRVLESFRKNRSRIEALLREKFLLSPVESTGETLLKSADIQVLEKRSKR